MPTARCTRGRRPPPVAPQRSSARLIEKEPATFVPVVAKATNLKALHDGLLSCSAALKKQVKGRWLLKRKTALSALDINHLAKAAGIGCSSNWAVDVAKRSTIMPP